MSIFFCDTFTSSPFQPFYDFSTLSFLLLFFHIYSPLLHFQDSSRSTCSLQEKVKYTCNSFLHNSIFFLTHPFSSTDFCFQLISIMSGGSEAADRCAGRPVGAGDFCSSLSNIGKRRGVAADSEPRSQSREAKAMELEPWRHSGGVGTAEPEPQCGGAGPAEQKESRKRWCNFRRWHRKGLKE